MAAAKLVQARPPLPLLQTKQQEIFSSSQSQKKLTSQKVTPSPLRHDLRTTYALYQKTFNVTAKDTVKKIQKAPCVPQKNISCNASIDGERFAERCIVLDTESTGSEIGKKNRATEIGCLELINFEPTGQIFHHWLNPEREVNQYVQKLIGYTWNSLRHYPRFQEIPPEFLDFIGEAGLIIHDASPDLKLIDEELEVCLNPYCPLQLKHPVIDTLKLAQRSHPGPSKKTNLNALFDFYGVDRSQRNKHSALLDSKLLTKVFC